MSLGSNRDYKTTDRRAREQLQKHAEMMARLLADFPEMERQSASSLALRVIEGKAPYPVCQQKLGG